LLSSGSAGSRGGSIVFVCTPRHDLERIIRQGPLQRLRLISWRAHPHVAFSLVVRITGIALGWIGSTTAFMSVTLLNVAVGNHITIEAH
jgi:hypothetical protein